MFTQTWEEFWWTNITGPNLVVTKVATSLVEGAHVVLVVPSDLPWRHSLRGAVHSEFQNLCLSSDIVVETIDAVDDIPPKTAPGKFILQRFADEETRTGYRDRAKATIQDYIRQTGILKNRVVWIKGLYGPAASEWVSFCRGLSPKSQEDGLFVLEVRGDINCQETNRMRVVRFSQLVSSYDVRLFNSFYLDSMKSLSNAWKNYMATVAAVICDTDAEMSESLLRMVLTGEMTLMEAIEAIADSEEFSRRGLGEDSEHILRFFRAGDLDEIDRRIWSAQVQTLFPVIELERIEIIKRFYHRIKTALEEVDTYQYGKILTDPYEVELGALCFMMARRKDDGLYQLYIPDDAARARIHFLHECRNNLAHAECCTREQVAELLKNS